MHLRKLLPGSDGAEARKQIRCLATTIKLITAAREDKELVRLPELKTEMEGGKSARRRFDLFVSRENVDLMGKREDEEGMVLAGEGGCLPQSLPLILHHCLLRLRLLG
ncbi:hypothetical protein C1H46_015664 [Malus baccata]|uniref:Uncharacterized protein n=1 Tax=Malus baccata TaxID=106549 RepID=A0A540MIZ6_MALBA|nr:hypothetical protein C1H46_015664 [Malus baccata]